MMKLLKRSTNVDALRLPNEVDDEVLAFAKDHLVSISYSPVSGACPNGINGPQVRDYGAAFGLRSVTVTQLAGAGDNRVQYGRVGDYLVVDNGVRLLTPVQVEMDYLLK